MLRVSYKGVDFDLKHVFDDDMTAEKVRSSHRFAEEPLLQWVAEQVRPGTYVDIGAHIGNHSVFFYNFCRSHAVIAAEAHPQTFDVLARNLVANCRGKRALGIFKPVYPRHLAITDRTGEARVGAIPRNMAGHTKLVPSGGIVVPSSTVDDLVEGADVALIKLDIEGSELMAIRGATETLDRCHPVVIAENHTPEQEAEFNSFLAPFGYALKTRWTGYRTAAWVKT
jgi:FkbM family methyltransferase